MGVASRDAPNVKYWSSQFSVEQSILQIMRRTAFVVSMEAVFMVRLPAHVIGQRPGTIDQLLSQVCIASFTDAQQGLSTST